MITQRPFARGPDDEPVPIGEPDDDEVFEDDDEDEDEDFDEDDDA